MADAPVLGAGSPECGFKSHLPHQNPRSLANGDFLLQPYFWFHKLSRRLML
jgi:hypothetical protein